MPELLFRTEDEWRSFLIETLSKEGLVFTDWQPGSNFRTFWEIVIRLLSEQSYQQKTLFDMFFLENLKDEFLDRKVKERNLTRKLGNLAKGTLVFSRSTPAPFDIEVQAGATFKTQDGKVIVKTDVTIIMKTGEQEVIVPASATVIGSDGNLSAGMELIQTGISISGIEKVVVSSPGFTGGTDAETNAELIGRYLDDIRNQPGPGNKRDYEKWAMEVQGVSSAMCIPMARGKGTVDVIILSSNGLPSQDTIDNVKLHIEEIRPLNADILVRGPNVYDVDFDITYMSSDVIDRTEEVKNTVIGFVKSLSIGCTIRVSHVISEVMKISGITDVVINSPSSNITIPNDSIPVIKNLVVTKGA